MTSRAFMSHTPLGVPLQVPTVACRLMADSVEKVGSRSLKEIRLNDDAIFDLICLPPQIDYGRLGLTRSRAMRSPASFSKDSAYDAEKILQCRRTDFFNRIGP